MPRAHDRGGWPTDQPIDRSEHQLADWERKIDAILGVLSRKRLLKVDELRRAIEELPPDRYEAMSYYERWADAIERLAQEKGLLTHEEMERKVSELRARGAGV
jgi:hypothetical protein